MCDRDLFSVCENTNPNAWMPEKLWGQSPAGIFGYSHMLGGFAGGQAQYARVPFADVGPLKIDNGFTDEQVLFLSDIYPTGYMGADLCEIKPGDVIAVWGCGPVGQFAIKSARLLGAERVIAIDRFEYRLRWARERAGATETINYEETDVLETLKEMTAGRGPDACIDAVGMESHTDGPLYAYDRTKQAMRLETDRPFALREAIMACRNGGIVSVIGVYGGFVDKFPMGAVMNRSLTIKTRPGARPALHAAAARTHREGRDRPELRHHPPAAARPGATGLQDVPRQAGRLPQGRAQALAPETPPVRVGQGKKPWPRATQASRASDAASVATRHVPVSFSWTVERGGRPRRTAAAQA